MKQQDDRPDDLPEALVAELKRVDKPTPIITAKVDRTIAGLARTHFAARRESRRVRPAWFAIAATVILAVFFVQTVDRVNNGDVDLYSDVDGSGQIDIADVLALARNGDQTTSDAALTAFAKRVVSLADDGDAS